MKGGILKAAGLVLLLVLVANHPDLMGLVAGVLLVLGFKPLVKFVVTAVIKGKWL